MMKKSFTLIELIFTVVIIGLIFTSVPKMMYVTSKSFEFTLKEDGIFNMMAKAMDISVRETDEQNTNSDDILIGGKNKELECNTTTNLRIGGFQGGRDCRYSLNLSDIKVDDNEDTDDESTLDDVDDFNGTESNATREDGSTKYIIYVFSGYSDDNFSYNYDNASLNYKFALNQDNNHSDIKRTKLILNYKDKNISSFQYFSANIGHMYIESRQW